MDDLNYKSNSHKSKNLESKERTASVVKGTVHQKKNSALKKFAGNFLSEDIEDTENYILSDLLIPTAKRLALDIFEALLGLNTSSSKHSGTRVSYKNYSSISSNNRISKESDRIVRSTGYEFDEVIFETRRDAEAVLDAMFDILDTYQAVRISDLYDLAGVSNSNYAACKYGWINLEHCRIERTRDGYILKLPKAQLI